MVIRQHGLITILDYSDFLHYPFVERYCALLYVGLALLYNSLYNDLLCVENVLSTICFI